MVILTQGGTIIRDAVANTIATGQYGTDGTTESTSDTGLGTPVAATKLSVSKTSAGLTTEFTHDLDSVTGNGNTLREFTIQTSTTDVNRVTTTDLEKDNTKEVVTGLILFTSIN